MNATDKTKTDMPQRHLRIGIDAACIPIFFELLRNGFSADVTVGCGLEHLLCNQLDIAPDYLYSRVQTVFLNNSPLDDLASTSVPDGAVMLIQGTPMVFKLEGNEFEPQPVETGLRAEGHTAITTGLDVDSTIAVAGVFQLKSLLLKSQIGDTD